MKKDINSLNDEQLLKLFKSTLTYINLQKYQETKEGKKELRNSDFAFDKRVDLDLNIALNRILEYGRNQETKDLIVKLIRDFGTYDNAKINILQCEDEVERVFINYDSKITPKLKAGLKIKAHELLNVEKDLTAEEKFNQAIIEIKNRKKFLKTKLKRGDEHKYSAQAYIKSLKNVYRKVTGKRFKKQLKLDEKTLKQVQKIKVRKDWKKFVKTPLKESEVEFNISTF